MKHKIKKMLKQISDAFKRRLDPTTRLMVEIGYLTENLQRSDVGTHQLLNFVETHFNGEFIEFLKGIREEKRKEEAEAKKS